MGRADSGFREAGLSLLMVLWAADPVSPLYVSAEELRALGVGETVRSQRAYLEALGWAPKLLFLCLQKQQSTCHPVIIWGEGCAGRWGGGWVDARSPDHPAPRLGCSLWYSPGAHKSQSSSKRLFSRGRTIVSTITRAQAPVQKAQSHVKTELATCGALRSFLSLLRAQVGMDHPH